MMKYVEIHVYHVLHCHHFYLNHSLFLAQVSVKHAIKYKPGIFGGLLHCNLV